METMTSIARCNKLDKTMFNHHVFIDNVLILLMLLILNNNNLLSTNAKTSTSTSTTTTTTKTNNDNKEQEQKFIHHHRSATSAKNDNYYQQQSSYTHHYANDIIDLQQFADELPKHNVTTRLDTHSGDDVIQHDIIDNLGRFHLVKVEKTDVGDKNEKEAKEEEEGNDKISTRETTNNSESDIRSELAAKYRDTDRRVSEMRNQRIPALILASKQANQNKQREYKNHDFKVSAQPTAYNSNNSSNNSNNNNSKNMKSNGNNDNKNMKSNGNNDNKNNNLATMSSTTTINGQTGRQVSDRIGVFDWYLFTEAQRDAVLRKYNQYKSNRDLGDPAYYALLILYTLLISIGTFGNGLVCLTVARKPKKMLTSSNILIVNLAFSDLLLCLFTMPFSFIEISSKYWPMGLMTCKLVSGLQATSIFVSTISITAISLNRYKMIVHPTQNSLNTIKLSTFMSVIAIWVCALALASPLFIWKTLHEPEDMSDLGFPGRIQFCVEQWPIDHGRSIYSFGSMTFQYVMPIVIVAWIYGKINSNLGNRMINKSRQTQLEWHKRRQLRAMRKNKILLLSIPIIFAFSWLPLNIINLVSDIIMNMSGESTGYQESTGITNENAQTFKIFFALCHAVGCSSAISNPILYGFFNDNFRREFNEIFNECFNCCWHKFNIHFFSDDDESYYDDNYGDFDLIEEAEQARTLDYDGKTFKSVRIIRSLSAGTIETGQAEDNRRLCVIIAKYHKQKGLNDQQQQQQQQQHQNQHQQQLQPMDVVACSRDSSTAFGCTMTTSLQATTNNQTNSRTNSPGSSIRLDTSIASNIHQQTASDCLEQGSTQPGNVNNSAIDASNMSLDHSRYRNVSISSKDVTYRCKCKRNCHLQTMRQHNHPVDTTRVAEQQQQQRENNYVIDKIATSIRRTLPTTTDNNDRPLSYDSRLSSCVNVSATSDKQHVLNLAKNNNNKQQQFVQRPRDRCAKCRYSDHRSLHRSGRIGRAKRRKNSSQLSRHGGETLAVNVLRGTFIDFKLKTYSAARTIISSTIPGTSASSDCSIVSQMLPLQNKSNRQELQQSPVVSLMIQMTK